MPKEGLCSKGGNIYNWALIRKVGSERQQQYER